jgi:hypothetical protein
MDVLASKGTLDQNAPVYAEYPGAAVFNMVCINCHGAKADSLGRQASTLQTMTGGEARVANLRDGLFGPADDPGGNRKAVFQDYVANGVAVDDWGARYMAWMALGGTTKIIPQTILNVVATTPVMGIPRKLAVNSANMLGAVQDLCSMFAGATVPSIFAPPDFGKPWDASLVWDAVMRGSHGVLLTTNGDAELWARLCSLDNPTPVAALIANVSGDAKSILSFDFEYHSAGLYPAGVPVGNDRGLVDDGGVNADNLVPWCIKVPDTGTLTQEQVDYATSYLQSVKTSDGKSLPMCPPGLFSINGVGNWATRGAINGGLAVFLYLNEVVANKYTPVPPFDQCEALTYAQ